jgi:hypothetical protein
MVASSIIDFKAIENSRVNETGILWRPNVKAVIT